MNAATMRHVDLVVAWGSRGLFAGAVASSCSSHARSLGSPTSRCTRAGTRSKTACCGTRAPKASRRLEVARGSAAAAAGIRARAMCSLRSTAHRFRHAGRRHRLPSSQSGAARASRTPCSGSARGRRSRSRWRRRRAAARCISCSPRSASSRCSSARRCACAGRDDQATLHFFWLCVAFFGVFTLLVQRPARSARLGLLLGRRGRVRAAAAAVPALHAGVSRAAARAGRNPADVGLRRARCICRRCAARPRAS